MLEGIEINCHSSIKIKKSKTIYIDPFRISKEFHDADYIFITHSHYDHFSIEDILKINKEDTVYITVEETKEKLLNIGVSESCIVIVKPNNEYAIEGISFNTYPAYNIGKPFHPKRNDWVGYVINLDNVKYYIAGDTDDIPEIESITCDIAFLPIGGTYTMNAKKAAELANTIDTKIVIPTHYGEIVGSKKDEEEFKRLTNKEVVILIK